MNRLLRSGRANGQLTHCLNAARSFRKTPSIVKEDWIFQLVFRFALVAQNSTLAAELMWHRCAVRATFSFCSEHHPLFFDWAIDNKEHHFIFAFYSFDPMVYLASERFLALLPLLFHVNICEHPNLKQVSVNLGDSGYVNGISFSDNDPNAILVPDTSFLIEKGYKQQREFFNADPGKHWSQRFHKAFWRGSTTGVKTGVAIDLPRVRLCRLSESLGETLDCGLVEANQLDRDEIKLLQSFAIWKQFVPWQEFGSYRYHIDIDGNSNSWSALFIKLLSGGLIFKVDSPFGFKQWYYDLLLPNINYIPVKSDLSDLVEKIYYAEDHPQEAQAIAERGRNLARSISYESALISGVQSILNKRLPR